MIKNTLLVFISIMFLSGCATMAVPKKMENVIMSDINYTTDEGRVLASKYKSSIENVFNIIRSKYNCSELEFFDNTGIGFYRMPKDNSNNAYFGMQVGANLIFNTLQTDFNKRAATAFSRYGKDLLEILVEQKEVIDDPKIYGVVITLGWWARDFLVNQYYGGTAEYISIGVSKQNCKDYLDLKISNQEFINKANVYGTQGTRSLGKVEIDLRQIL